MRLVAWLGFGLGLAACGSEVQVLFGDPSLATGSGGAAPESASSSGQGSGGAGGAGAGPNGSATTSSSAGPGSTGMVGAMSSSASGGAGACEAMAGDSGCMTCAKNACCAPLSACLADPACACIYNCNLKNGWNCPGKCGTNALYAPWRNFADCRNLSCLPPICAL